jgi:hypothetical protein
VEIDLAGHECQDASDVDGELGAVIQRAKELLLAWELGLHEGLALNGSGIGFHGKMYLFSFWFL